MMNYSDYVNELGILLQYPVVDASSATPFNNDSFNIYLPRVIEGAEQRIYRELDFLRTRVTISTATLTAGSRQVTLPSEIIVMQKANFITPAGNAPVVGERNELLIVSTDFIDQVWPQESVIGSIEYIAQLDDTTCLVAGTPDDNYVLEVTGIFRPEPLSSTNTTTYITQKYPDLMSYASMVIASGYQRNFGQGSDDPKMAISWESMYQTAKMSALEEEQRRKSQGTNWTPYSQTPQSSPRK